uniref:TSA: Wollemia nobilis Ref_Wollemi_Transcript_2171_1649 transcribed RNA sequence n=1 Tax=Wollemia nobilis TaxID=56998 RepID=A0A0C9RQG6_9CONI
MDLLPSENGHGHGSKLHVAMFPWLAHGHISPYIQLSKKLAEKGLTISFVSTPLNIAKIIKPSFATLKSPGQVHLLELPLPPVDGLPAGVDNTADLPIHLTPLFDKAVDGLEKPLEDLLGQIRPDCVVFDFLQWWTPRAAAKFGIPAVFFPTFGAAFSSYAIHPARQGSESTAEDLTKPPPGYPSAAISWKPYEALAVMGCNRPQGPNGISYLERTFRCYEHCSAMAVKTCDEVEGKFVRYLQEVIGKPVLPLGPLLPGVASRESDCLAWLERRTPGSVVYVAFGSNFFMSREDMGEIALGLEGSMLPFLWALRLPHGRDGCRVTDLLPPGFEERIRGRGLVVGEWAPQVEILRHPSTGGFMTHCGWSSLMEGMGAAVPFVACPMLLDQGLNSRLVCEELGVGVEVRRGDEGLLKREEIRRAVRTVMVDEEGRRVRTKASDLGQTFKSKISQDAYLKEFVGHLQSMVSKKM